VTAVRSLPIEADRRGLIALLVGAAIIAWSGVLARFLPARGFPPRRQSVLADARFPLSRE